MKNRKVWIYAFCEGNIIRYVGKSADPMKRLYQRIWNARSTPGTINPCLLWIRKLLDEGKRPTVKRLEEVEESRWEEAERQWINKLTSEGVVLLNVTPGGLRGTWTAEYSHVGYKFDLTKFGDIFEAGIDQQIERQRITQLFDGNIQIKIRGDRVFIYRDEQYVKTVSTSEYELMRRIAEGELVVKKAEGE